MCISADCDVNVLALWAALQEFEKMTKRYIGGSTSPGLLDELALTHSPRGP